MITNTLSIEEKTRIAVDLVILDVFEKKGDVGIQQLTAYMQTTEFETAVGGYLHLMQ